MMPVCKIKKKDVYGNKKGHKKKVWIHWAQVQCIQRKKRVQLPGFLRQYIIIATRSLSCFTSCSQ